jgi:anti-sigma regulatory factor (Ser/Thr protein kinase)
MGFRRLEAVMAAPNEVTFRLSPRPDSVRRARALAHAVLGDWQLDQDVIETAELVLSELVTNALRVCVPPDRHVGVRIARLAEDGLLRLEVSDAGAGTPVVRVPCEDEMGGRGLLLVESLVHRWGFERRTGGTGKTVWAELKAPDIVPASSERQIAAVAVRTGQRVHVWSAWHTVRSVRCERHAAGGLAVVLGLGEGPALRCNAGEPLHVRDEEGDG